MYVPVSFYKLNANLGFYTVFAQSSVLRLIGRVTVRSNRLGELKPTIQFDRTRIRSSGLSDSIPRFIICPRCRRELLNLGNLGPRQAREQIIKVIERVDSM
jgi:hypothetical protein